MKPLKLPTAVQALKGPSGISIAFVTITPALARMWLDERAPNRNLRPQQSDKLQRAIARGDWITTHQGIGFRRSDGKLIDGQHRLRAISDGTVSVVCLVAWDIPDEAAGIIDTGTSRTVPDIFKMMDVAKGNRILSITRQMQTLFFGPSYTSSTVLSAAEVRTIYEWAKEPIEWGLKTFSNAYSSPVVTACMFAYVKAPTQVQSFVDRLQGKAVTSTDDPAVKLALFLKDHGTGHTEGARAKTLALVLSSLRALLRGKQLERLQTPPDLEAVRNYFEPAWISKVGDWPLIIK